MSLCTLCMKVGGPTLCTNYENIDVIRFLCKKLRIGFEKSFGFKDPLKPMDLIIPLCPHCHEMLAQLQKVQMALKETKDRLDQILFEIIENVRLAPIHNLSQTELDNLDPVVDKNCEILRAEIRQVTSVSFGGTTMKTIESVAEPNVPTLPTNVVLVSQPDCGADDELEEEDVETFDANFVEVEIEIKEFPFECTSKVNFEADLSSNGSKKEPSPSQHGISNKRKRKAGHSKIATTPSNVVIYTCDLCHGESLEFLDVRSLKLHTETIHNSAKMLYLCSELNCNKQFPLKILYEKHMEFHAEKLTKKRFTCDHCEIRFTCTRPWKLHLTSRAHNGTLEPRMKTSPKCRFCTMQTVYAERFRDHEVKEHPDKLNYSCEKCDEKFSSAIILDSHVQSHDLNGPYKCLICENQYEHASELNYHLAIRHIPMHKSVRKDPSSSSSSNNITKFTDTTCNICGRYYSTWAELTKHLKNHAANKKTETLFCELCTDKKILRLSSYLSHLIRFHESGEKKLVCSQCSKKFATNYMLERHVKNHTLDASKPLACELCDERFKLDDEVGLAKHRNTKHNKPYKKFPCTANNCDMDFHNRQALCTHQRKNHPELFIYSCSLCTKNYCEETFLETHLNTHAEAGKIGPFDCCVCKNRYSTSNDLADHLLMHTRENKFQCTECDKSFTYKKYLKEHMITNHGEPRPYDCKTCGKRFINQSNLNSHKQSHEDPAELLKKNPRTCKICGLQFSRAVQLRYHHLRQHRPKIVKVNVCEVCGKTVAHLRRHMEVHEGEKKYSCYFCDKRFVQWAVLQCHMYTHTKEKPFQCPICKSDFNQHTSFNGHMKKVHKKNESFFKKAAKTTGTWPNSYDSGNYKTTLEPKPGPSRQMGNLFTSGRSDTEDHVPMILKDGESLDFDALLN